MTAYPFSTLPENRMCTDPIFDTGETCSEYPCIHTPCHDEDWLADQEDFFASLTSHSELWACFNSPETSRPHFTTGEWIVYESKFPRCVRIKLKQPQIQTALLSYRDWTDEAMRADNERRLAAMPKAIRKEEEERIKREINAMGAVMDEVRKERREAGRENCTYEDWIVLHKDLPKDQRMRLDISDDDIEWALRLVSEGGKTRG
jgi:hypothetical protein